MSLIRRLDWVLIVAVLLLAMLGTLLVWSATAHRIGLTGGDPNLFLRRHLVSLGFAVVVAVAVGFWGRRALRTWAPALYLLAVSGLVSVLFVGVTINGSQSWIQLPAGLSIQPGEFGKIALVVGMAAVLAERSEANSRAVPTFGDSIWALSVAGLPIVLVLLQPDVGTALVLAVTATGILVLSGVHVRVLLTFGLGLLVLAIAGILAGVLADYQVARFTAFLDPESDPHGRGYNLTQATLAIGSGGFAGQGLFQGARTSGSYVPEQHTDFIFTVAGEELGFAGAAALLLLLALVLWRGVRITSRASDLFGRLVGAGVVCWLAVQTFENVGMTMGLAPITGVPLPFVSYGGSSLAASLVAVALLENIHWSASES